MAVADRLDSLVGDLAADLPGAGEMDIRAELARKCKEFCARSRVWRVCCKVSHIAGGAGEIPLGGATSGARIVTLDQVWYRHAIAARSGIGWRLALGSDGGDIIALDRCPSPVREWSLRFSAALMPVTDFLMPEWIYEKYGDTLVAGVLARLKRRLNRPYTDIQGVSAFDADWRRGIGYAAAEADGEVRGVNFQPIIPGESSWTVEEGVERRRADAVPEYAELLAAFRTLVADLVARGYLPKETGV